MSNTSLKCPSRHSLLLVGGFVVLASLAFASTARAQAPIVLEDWVDQFGSVPSAVDIAEAIDANGSMYVGGYVNAALPGETHEGGNDGFIRKYDSDGVVLWTDQFGTSFSDRVQGVAVATSAVYVVGETDGDLPTQTASGGGDAYLRKYDLDGNEQWTRQFGTDDFDTAFAVTVASSGVYVVGNTLSAFPGQTLNGNGDVFIRKYDVSGNELWTRQFGTSGFQEGFGVTSINDETYITGVTDGVFPGETSAGSEDVFIRKYDANGSSTWTRQFGSDEFDQGFSITTDGTDVYVTGETFGTFPSQTSQGGADVFVTSYSQTGVEQWTRQFGTSNTDVGTGISVNNTGVYIGGYTEDAFSGFTNQGSSDIFMRKYSATGTEGWTYQLGTSGTERANGIATTDASLFLTGFTTGTFPGETSEGNLDIFALKLIQDSDSDNIFDEVDTNASVFSDDFSDGTSDGSITTRGDQDLTLTDATSTSVGVRIQADAGGGPTDAEIDLCSGSSSIMVSAGDDVNFTCGSVTISVLQGVVEAEFVAVDGTTATADLNPGIELTFEPETTVFTAPASNATSVEVLIDDGQGGQETLSIDPGETEVSGGIILNPTKDAYMRKGKLWRNEGANPLLRVKGTEQGGGVNRALLGFDPQAISDYLTTATFTKATLVLYIQDTNQKWGKKNNRSVDVHPLLTDFDEGNGLGGDLPGSESTRGSGTGATWDCAADTDISNKQTDCGAPLWDGGDFGTTTSQSVIHTNTSLGVVTWDVTSDVLGGSSSWLVKKNNETKRGKVWYYSREGAAAENNMTFAPQLILEE